MLKKVLVAIDASHIAAVSQSIAMATKMIDTDGRLVLLNVLENARPMLPVKSLRACWPKWQPKLNLN